MYVIQWSKYKTKCIIKNKLNKSKLFLNLNHTNLCEIGTYIKSSVTRSEEIIRFLKPSCVVHSSTRLKSHVLAMDEPKDVMGVRHPPSHSIILDFHFGITIN